MSASASRTTTTTPSTAARCVATEPGDEVEVWFTAVSKDRDDATGDTDASTEVTARSRANTSRTRSRPTPGSSVLILANEDYTGVNPAFPDPLGGGPKYVDEHVAAFEANGITPDVWDVDAQGVPHDLGVLSHYTTVLWYLGDNRLTQDIDDFFTELPVFGAGFDLEDSSVAERAQYLTLAVREHLNAGGKLIHAGETTAWDGLLDELLGGVIGGIYYGLDDFPDQQCVVEDDPFSDCLLLANDFAQYYLGAWDRGAIAGADGVVGRQGPMDGDEASVRRTGRRGQPDRRSGRVHAHERSVAAGPVPAVRRVDGDRVRGCRRHGQRGRGRVRGGREPRRRGYMRLARTFDLTDAHAPPTSRSSRRRWRGRPSPATTT